MERTSYPLVFGIVVAVGIYVLNVLPGIFSFTLGLALAGSGMWAISIPSVGTIVDKVTQTVTAGMTVVPRVTYPPLPTTLRDVQMRLRHAGLEKGSLILGVDFTKSNLDQGYKTYHGQSLHALDMGRPNPYQSVIASVGETLAVFDDDNQIPAYGFGDKETTDRSVFPLGSAPANGFAQVLEQYAEKARVVKLDGPTSFAPLIYEACELVRKSNYEFHILVIITDGAVNDKNNATVDAITYAANEFPLSIIAVGVGDGPWDEMERFDDDLPARRFDNFTFVNYEKLKREYDGNDIAFAEAALRETPAQFKFARTNNMLCAPVAKRGRSRRQD